MSKFDYRPFVPAMGKARYFGLTPQALLDALPAERVERWRAKVAAIVAVPFKGVTTGGEAVSGLFSIRDEHAPTREILQAIATLFERLTPEQIKTVHHPIGHEGKHKWFNGVPRHEQFGIWLDEVTPAVREAALAVIRASLSPAGYERSRDIMRLNGFLGEIVGAPSLAEFAYQLHFWGEPSPTEPWGWQLYGHHLCLTCFVLGGQMTLTPTFMGAEPRYADHGQYAGVTVFDDEERHGLELVRSFSTVQRRKAIVHDTTLPSGLPPGRHQDSDGMMLGGAFQDNAIVPYEGIAGPDLEPGQRRALLDLTERYLSTLPQGPLRARMSDVERHLAETHFCWSGGTAEDSVFYYRIQSPVVLIEFDHHKGVLLTNETPQRFHTHTIVRTPNGNDYGMDLLRLHYETSPHHKTLIG